MTSTEAEKLIEEHLGPLMEHFDAVQILATWDEEGESRHTEVGGGNWYARQGLAHTFINAETAQIQAFENAEYQAQTEEDDDDTPTV